MCGYRDQGRPGELLVWGEVGGEGGGELGEEGSNTAKSLQGDPYPGGSTLEGPSHPSGKRTLPTPSNASIPALVNRTPLQAYLGALCPEEFRLDRCNRWKVDFSSGMVFRGCQGDPGGSFGPRPPGNYAKFAMEKMGE